MTWPISIAGLGTGPTDVELRNRQEDPLLREAQLWEGHRAVVSVARDASAPLVIENLSIRMNAEAITDYHALFLEGGPSAASPPERHIVRNVVMRTSTIASTTGRTAIRAGNNVLFQNVLLHGPWSTCSRIASAYPTNGAPPAIGAAFINVTCRLNGEGVHVASAGFDVAGVRDSTFINLVVDNTTSSTPGLLRAQPARSGGSSAVDVPRSFVARAIHYRGFSPLFGRFTEADGDYDFGDLRSLARTTMLFVSDTDSRLVEGASPIDNGIEPSSIVDRWLPGLSVEGVRREGRVIDQGAYEQGN